MTPRRRAILAGSVLGGFLLLLAAAGAAAWCDEERFGLFLAATPAPREVPSVAFTVDDAALYPDVQRALNSVGTPVRAHDPENARAFLDRLAAENVAAVEVREGKFYLSSYEQVPSETWTRVCS